MAVSLNPTYNVVNFTIYIFNVKMEMRYNKQLPWGGQHKIYSNSYSTKEEKKKNHS